MTIPAPSTNLNSYFALFARSTPLPGEPLHPFIGEVVDWDTSAVTTMARTFSGALNENPFLPAYLNPFNFDISGWETSNVTNMNSMFRLTSVFNQDIGGWNTSQVTRMDSMFSRAAVFNQDISNWDVSSVTLFQGMFRDAEAFDQNLGAWDISSARGLFSMFDRSGISMANFDATLEGWARLDEGETQVPTDQTLGAEGVFYSNIDAVETLTETYGWEIEDAIYAFAGSSDADTIDGAASLYRIDTDGLAGDDQITGSDFGDRLAGDEGADTLEGGLGLDTLIGGDGDDFIFGARQGNAAGDLADRLFGGAGNDSLDGGDGNDELRGDAGNDTQLGGFGADTLIGGADEDVLTGSSLSDLIFGGDGDDFINGGFGYDRLNGGAGADRFFHSGNTGHGTDWIQDYSAAQGDVLQYGGAAGASDFLVQRANAANAGLGEISEVFVTHIPSGNLLWALVDGGDQTSLTVLAAGVTFDLLG